MSTDLAVQNPRGMTGDRNEIQTVRDRILNMIPGAASAPPEVQWATAQLSVALDLNPINGEIYIGNMGTESKPKYQPLIGIAGRRRMARRQADYIDNYEGMDELQLKKNRGELYDERDVGVTCTLYRLDMAAKCAKLGIPYKGTTAHGYWRKKARQHYKWDNSKPKGQKKVMIDSWDSDNIPETWTPYEVAEKRALTNAIKKAYDMNGPIEKARDAGVEFDVDEASVRLVNDLAHELEVDERIQADMETPLVSPNAAERDDDGDLFEAKTVVAQAEEIIDGEFSEIPGATDDVGPQSLDEVDELDPNGPVDGDTGEFEYAHLHSELHDKAKALVDWSRKLHVESNGPATKKMLGTLKGCIKTAASEDTRKAILEILIGTTAMDPGYNVTKKLIDVLKETEGRGDNKVKRVEYRQDVADIVHYLGELVTAYRESQQEIA